MGISPSPTAKPRFCARHSTAENGVPDTSLQQQMYSFHTKLHPISREPDQNTHCEDSVSTFNNCTCVDVAAFAVTGDGESLGFASPGEAAEPWDSWLPG